MIYADYAARLCGFDEEETNQPREDGGCAAIDTNAGHDGGGPEREIRGARRHGSLEAS